MTSDIEIARSVEPLPIAEVAGRLGLASDEWNGWGRGVAKLEPSVLERPRTRSAAPRLILVSAITPTPAGEGKTTTSVGLADALAGLGESVCLALREPSLGPCMGVKGGAAGGGRSQVIPMERINLHFTGDFHAIGAAHNLLAAALDNHLHFGNELDIDPRRVSWKRVIDMNDRALRQVVLGLGGPSNGMPRESGFDITAASEVMAMLCLAEDSDDLRVRLDRTLVAFTRKGLPVTAAQLNVTGAMLALLGDALKPNLVQTLEGTPALLHGGPFANIAHGCNSLIATRTAMHLADWTVTEAGFGFDLGAEKFFDIKCAGTDLDTAAVVLVSTVRALKMHGGVKRSALGEPNAAAVARGLPNLEKHIESIRAFGESPVVAVNRFSADTASEIEAVTRRCAELDVPCAVADHHLRGGAGASELARAVILHAEKSPSPFRPLYQRSDSVTSKIEAVTREMYGARSVVYTKSARRNLDEVERLGFGDLPVCIAKVPGSLSDDARRRGRPLDFEITVREIQINAGAGFLVVLTGDILRMPGLPRRPLAESIDVIDGEIVGLE